MTFDIKTAKIENQFDNFDLMPDVQNNNFDLSTAVIQKDENPSFNQNNSSKNISAQFSEYKPDNVFDAIRNAYNWVTQIPSDAMKSQSNNIKIADIEMKGIYNGFKGLNKADVNQINSLQNQNTKSRYNDENNWGIIEDNYKYKEGSGLDARLERLPNYTKKNYVASMQNLPIVYETIKAGGVGSAVGAIGGAAIGAAAGLLTTKASTLAMAVQGARIGALWGGRINSAKRIFEIEAGLCKNELRQINDEIIAEGNKPLTEQEMNLLAIGVGGVNAGLEMFSLEKLLGTVPGSENLIKLMKNKNLRELAKNPAIRTQLTEVLKKYSTSIMSEGLTEAAQEAVTIVAAEKSRQIGGLEATPLNENVKRIIEAGSMGAGATIFLGGVGSTAQTITILKKKGMTDKSARETAEKMTSEEKFQLIEENTDTLLKSVQDLPSVQEFEKTKKLQDSYFNQIKNTGADDVEANVNAELYAKSFANLAKLTGLSLDDIEKEANIVIKSLTVEEANEQFEKDNEELKKQMFRQSIDNSVNNIPKYIKKEIKKSASYPTISIKDKNLNKKEKQIVRMIFFNNIQEKSTLNTIQDFKKKYGSLSSDFSDEEIQKAFDFYNKGNYEVHGEYKPERIETQEVLNPDWRPVYTGTETSKEEIIEHYESKTSTDKIGHGYNFYSMSNNAVKAYSQGSMPISKWNKKNILERISNIINEYSLPVDLSKLDKLKVDDLKNYLKQDGYHHTSKFYNSTDFYKIDIEKLLNLIQEDSPNIYYQGAISKKTSQKAREVLNALQKIANGSEEETVKNLRKDLEQYGGTNDVTFIFGNNKKGIQHIAQKHGAKTLLKVFDTVIDGNVIRYSDKKKTVIIGKDNYEAVLSLDENGNKKTWLLSGWDVTKSKEKSSDVNSEVSTQSATTQIKPTFSRQDLGAELNNIITDDVPNLNPDVNNHEENPNIHYQTDNKKSALDYNYITNQVTGEKITIEMNEDIKVDKIEPQKISSELPFVISQKPSDNKKSLIKSLGLSNGKFIKAVNNNTGETAKINNKTIEKSLSNISVKNAYYNDFCNIVLNVENLFESSQKILSYNDTKKNTNTKIARYANIANVGNKDYLLEFILKNNGDLVLYSLNLIKKSSRPGYDKIATVYASEKNSSAPREDIYSITNIKDIFKSKLVEKYNNDYKNSQSLKNNLEIHYQEKDNIENARGFTYERKNFDGTTKDNLIVLLKNKADKSTLPHEFAHVYLITLNNIAKYNDKAKDLLNKVNRWLRYDGKEYTTAQHEKFANGFVAYVRSGKAPSYSMKRVFENFRKWLNDLYNSITLSDNIELDSETKKVFDELLGDISVDAQEKISNEIIKKSRENALLRLRNDETKKGKVKFNELNEKQRQYRDTAYDIIFYALKHSKNEETRNFVTDISQLKMILGNNKANKKNKRLTRQAERLTRQAERLNLILAETEDAFSAHDGFLPEWGEFFNDPGVSYDNLQVGADAELALNALDVIVNKKYLYDTNSLEDLTNQEVTKNQYEYEYLIEQYKNQNDKTNVLCAFYNWVDNIHPYLQEDFINKWENDSNEIDRYQSLSKFEQAKEDLKIKAAKMKGFGDFSWQFAEYARAVVKRLDFMTESDKAKIFDKLKDFNSFSDIQRNLDEVMDFAETLYSVSERKMLADDIVREVKRTIHTWQNGIKKTKYTYPANKLFSRLRDIEKLSGEEIEYLYDAQVNEEIKPSYESDNVNTEDYYEIIEKMYIEFKYNGNYYNSTEFLQELLNRIQSAKFTAKVARNELDFERKMEQINIIDECAKAVDVRKSEIQKDKLIKKAGVANSFGANLNGFLKMIFNEKIKNKFSLDYLYAVKDGKVGKDRREVLDKLKDIWGYKGSFSDIQLFNRLINMTKKEFKIKQRYTPDMVNGTYRIVGENEQTGQSYTQRTLSVRNDNEIHSEWDPEPIELSRIELLYYYIQAKNDVSYKILTDMGDETTPPKGQFDKEEFDNLLKELTPQEQLMGDILQLAAEKYFNELNKYHIKKYHTDLQKVNAYYPRKSQQQDVKMLDLFNDYVHFNASDSMQKQRTAGPGIRISPANALAVLFDHIEKANTIIVMGEQLDLMNKVFSEQNLKNKIEAVWGEKITKEFYNQITGNMFAGQAMLTSLQETFFGKIVNNVVKSNIFFKPLIGIKQIISFMNYGKGDEYVSAGEWLKAFAKQTFTPSEWKKNIDFMLENEYLRDRFKRGGSSDALKRELETRMFSKISLLDEIWGMPVQYGDISAIILGGKPYIDVLMKKGYTKEQAFKIFIETTVNDQQSSIPSTLSNMQRNASKSPLTKMFFAYQNTPWQYYRQVTNAVMSAIQTKDKTSVIKAGKMILLYGWLFPAIFNMVSSLSLISGDDDDIKKDLNPLVTFSSLLTQHPIFGELLEGVLNAFDGKQYNSQDLFSRYLKSVNKLIRNIKNDKVTPKDIWDALVAFSEPATGVPVNSIGNTASGLYDISQGDYLKGTIKTAGYSQYRAEKIAEK